MSRGDGFEIMDVATDILDDVKFKRLARAHPELVPVAMAGYVGILGASWREGERLPAIESWPGLLAYDEEAIEALQDVGLLDSKSRINARSWSKYFLHASNRRSEARARWDRANKARAARNTADEPRGDEDATGAIRTAPYRTDSVSSSGGGLPRPGARARTRGSNGATPPSPKGSAPTTTATTDSEERR